MCSHHLRPRRAAAQEVVRGARLFIETAFKVVGVDVAWRGEGVDEVGYDKAAPARELVKIDPKYFRPTCAAPPPLAWPLLLAPPRHRARRFGAAPG